MRFEVGVWVDYFHWKFDAPASLPCRSTAKMRVTPGGKNHLKRRLNLFQSSSLSFWDEDCHKDNSASSHDSVDCEGTCRKLPCQSAISAKHERACCRGEGEREREPPVLQSNRKFAVIVIAHDVVQFANTAILPPRPLIFTGRIWQCRKNKYVLIYIYHKMLGHILCY